MKRFLKPRSGCGRPDLGENVHRKSLEKTWFHFIKSVSEIMTIAYGFFRLQKKECAAINGDASRMIFKDPKSLNLKTTIVNSNKNASFRIAHPLCWRWAGYYTQIRKIRYPANHLLFFTYVLKLFLYFFKQTFCFCCSAHL